MAITMLTIAGVGMVTYVAQTVDSVREMSRRDREASAAAEELLGAMLWTRGELAARVGHSRLPCCVLIVEPLSPVLYRVALADTTTAAVILETSLYARAAAP